MPDSEMPQLTIKLVVIHSHQKQNKKIEKSEKSCSFFLLLVLLGYMLLSTNNFGRAEKPALQDQCRVCLYQTPEDLFWWKQHGGQSKRSTQLCSWVVYSPSAVSMDLEFYSLFGWQLGIDQVYQDCPWISVFLQPGQTANCESPTLADYIVLMTLSICFGQRTFLSLSVEEYFFSSTIFFCMLSCLFSLKSTNGSKLAEENLNSLMLLLQEVPWPLEPLLFYRL